MCLPFCCYAYQKIKERANGEDEDAPNREDETQEANPTFEMEHPNAPAGVHSVDLTQPPPAYGDAPGVKDTTLPFGWAEAVDPSSGDIYYYHESTGETAWERPGQA